MGSFFAGMRSMADELGLGQEQNARLAQAKQQLDLMKSQQQLEQLRLQMEQAQQAQDQQALAARKAFEQDPIGYLTQHAHGQQISPEMQQWALQAALTAGLGGNITGMPEPKQLTPEQQAYQQQWKAVVDANHGDVVAATKQWLQMGQQPQHMDESQQNAEWEYIAVTGKHRDGSPATDDERSAALEGLALDRAQKEKAQGSKEPVLKTFQPPGYTEPRQFMLDPQGPVSFGGQRWSDAGPTQREAAPDQLKPESIQHLIWAQHHGAPYPNDKFGAQMADQDWANFEQTGQIPDYSTTQKSLKDLRGTVSKAYQDWDTSKRQEAQHPIGTPLAGAMGLRQSDKDRINLQRATQTLIQALDAAGQPIDDDLKHEPYLTEGAFDAYRKQHPVQAKPNPSALDPNEKINLGDAKNAPAPKLNQPLLPEEQGGFVDKPGAGKQGAPAPPSAAPQGGPAEKLPPSPLSPATDPRRVAGLILQEAAKNNVPGGPQFALAVARMEGLGKFRGDQGEAGGTYQLNVGYDATGHPRLGRIYLEQRQRSPFEEANDPDMIRWVMQGLGNGTITWDMFTGAKQLMAQAQGGRGAGGEW